jgi:hypothetical protein
MRDLTGHKITDRKRGAPLHATKKWIANTQKVDRRPAPGSLHRLVGTFGALRTSFYIFDRRLQIAVPFSASAS